MSEITKPVSSSPLIFREIVIGSRRRSNYWWATVVFLGSFGFLSVGLASFFSLTNEVFGNSRDILFFPQGLVMSFYGLVGILLSCYLWLIILWDVGQGYDEFNKETGQMKIFRWGFPGPNRRIQLIYSLADIEGIRIEIKEGLNPGRTLYIKIKGKIEVPLTRIGQPLTIEEVEAKAAKLASFLQVSIFE
jgi:hypothetical protein